MSEIIKINPTLVEYGLLETQRAKIIKMMKELPKFSEAPNTVLEEEIQKIFSKAFGGWANAPSTFIERVDRLCHSKFILPKNRAKTGSKNAQVDPNLRDPRTFITNSIPIEASDSLKSILESLQPSEIKFWKERMANYQKEFNFNESSDYSLLMQLITEEVIQYRLMLNKLADPSADTDLEMTNSMKRLQVCMEALGITRKQRQAAKSDVDGTVSLLSVELDKKLRLIAMKNNKDFEEEEQYMEIKNSRGGPRNIVPSIQEIVKIEKEFGLKD